MPWNLLFSVILYLNIKGFIFVFSVKPKITYIVNQTTSEMEEQVTLTCEASGDPTPTISWSSGGQVFSEAEQVW